MIKQIQWFERKFTLGLPAWMFPNLIERLRGLPPRLEMQVGLLPPKISTWRDIDSWSIQEHVGHLLDLEELWAARLDDFEAGKETLTPADLQNRKTHEANHNAQSNRDLLIALRKERFTIVKRLETYDEDFVQKPALHPRLNQPMNVVDLAFFVAEHDDHHIAAITALMRKLSKTPGLNS
ncbi:MAG: DinB family protein [bacterium]